MKKKKILITIGVITILSCIYFSFFYAYHGKVIDADTKQPIGGAVVVASWIGERGGLPAGGTSRLKNIKETLTDKNGEWKVRGARGIEGDIMENIMIIITLLTGTYYTKPPTFIIFKPGYCSYPAGFGIDACKETMRPFGVGQGEATKLLKLTNREDRLRALPSRVSGYGADEKQKEFIRLLNEERRYLGLEEY